MQASVPTRPRPFFLAEATEVTPTVAKAPPAIPFSASRRLCPQARRATSSSNCLESTEASPFHLSHRGRYRGSGRRQRRPVHKLIHRVGEIGCIWDAETTAAARGQRVVLYFCGSYAHRRRWIPA